MKNINWSLRFQNKVTLTALILQVIAIVYAVLGMFNVVPAIGEDVITNIAHMVIELFVLLGIVVDPTTKGVPDSDRAKQYTNPQ